MQNGRNLNKSGDDGRDLVLEILGAYASSLLSLARRHSLCADDAHDAYQRAVEILLRRAARLERDTAASWMRTVVKHEAMAVRAERQALLAREEPDLDARPATTPSEEERVERFDRLTAAAEALQSLKSQEVQALVLRAEGHSYREIGELMGWSYTKVNRLLSEGRASFRDRYEAIASGAECERWAPVLSRLCDGETSVRELVAIRRHLRRCPGCRATLRAYVDAPRNVGALVPAAAVAGLAVAPGAGLLSGLVETIGGGLGLHERVTLAAGKLSAAAEAATSSKLAAVAASTAALAGGGVVVERAVRHEATSPAAAKADLRPGSRDAAPTAPERVSPAPAAPSPVASDPATGDGAPAPAGSDPQPPAAPRPTPAPRADDFGVEAGAASAPAASQERASTAAPEPAPSAPASGAGDPGGEFAP